MADQENQLFAIKVDADDYAETAAGDAPPVSRTYQSEADFRVQKASYSAKRDYGNTYKDLVDAVPALDVDDSKQLMSDGGIDHDNKVKLSKKNVQLLGYAVGEMYYDKDYSRILELCERVRSHCTYDGRTAESLERWTKRCLDRKG